MRSQDPPVSVLSVVRFSRDRRERILKGSPLARSATSLIHFRSRSPQTPMIRRNATAEDFQNWEAYARTLTDAELIYAARDCRKVEAIWRGHDPVVEGFYSDQASTYGMELSRRRKA